MLRNECTHTFLYIFGHCEEYMLSLLLILISKSWRGGVSPALLSAAAVCVCRPFLVYLLPCLLARLFVCFCFKLTLLQSLSPLFTQNTPYRVTIETGSNLSKYISTESLILAHINNTKSWSAFSQKNEIKNWKIEKEVILRGKLVNNNPIVKFGSHKVSIFLKNLDSWVNNFIVKVIPLVTNLLGFFLMHKGQNICSSSGGAQEKGKTRWNSIYHQSWWFFQFHP